MPLQLDRANAQGQVAANGTFARAVVLVDISAILNAVGLSAAERRGQVKVALATEFNRGLAADGKTAAQIDADTATATAQLTADATAAKAALPTGTL